MTDPADRIYVALDTADAEAARALARRLAGHAGGIKLGLEFFSPNGPAGVRTLAAEGLRVFLDLKFHDIPNTVAGAMRAVVPLEPAIVTVHAVGGLAMMRAAAEAAGEAAARHGVTRPLVVAVTVLTSLDAEDLSALGYRDGPQDQVLRLATLACEAGLDGVVCSPHEVATLRRETGDDFVLVVPGVRPVWSAADDQKRIMTPFQAVRAGADYLVVGRPITTAPDPVKAARLIAEEIEET